MVRTFLLATVMAAALSLPSFADADEPEACEQVLKRLDDALKTAAPSGDQKAQVTDLRKKGLEKCKIEKDVEADADFYAALKILGQ